MVRAPTHCTSSSVCQIGRLSVAPSTGRPGRALSALALAPRPLDPRIERSPRARPALQRPTEIAPETPASRLQPALRE